MQYNDAGGAHQPMASGIGLMDATVRLENPTCIATPLFIIGEKGHVCIAFAAPDEPYSTSDMVSDTTPRRVLAY